MIKMLTIIPFRQPNRIKQLSFFFFHKRFTFCLFSTQCIFINFIIGRTAVSYCLQL